MSNSIQKDTKENKAFAALILINSLKELELAYNLSPKLKRKNALKLKKEILKIVKELG